MLPPDRQTLFSLCAINSPAKYVAGDFFDFFAVNHHRLGLVIADVSGKGVPAAIYMAVVRTKLRDFATPDRTPAEVVAEVNRGLAQENNQDMLVSLFFGYYDAATGDLTYCNGGHNPPYIVRSGGSLETLDTTGPIVAVFPDADFANALCHLEPEDLMFLFTDGITEASDGQGGRFGEQRLERFLKGCATQPVGDICQHTIEAAIQFSAGDLADDVTVLALRETPLSCIEVPLKQTHISPTKDLLPH